MIALIRTLGPVAAMLVGLAGGTGLVGAVAWLFNEFVDNPHVRELVRVEERAACTIRTQEAADAAEKAERQRQILAGAAALKTYRDQAEARDRLEAEVRDQLESEIAENEQRLAAAGRSCRVDRDDVEWLQPER
jgi:hypothetical protein